MEIHTDREADSIRAQVEARVAQVESVAADNQARKADGRKSKRAEDWDPRKDEDFIRNCLQEDERGLGLITAALQEGKHLHNAATGTDMNYDGRRWEDDVTGEALSSVQETVRLLQEFAGRRADAAKAAAQADIPAEKLVERENADFKRAWKAIKFLQTERGRNIAWKFARNNDWNPLTVKGDGFDPDPNIFVTSNTILDTRTAEPVRPHWGQMLQKASPVPWLGIKEPAPRWEKFISEIFEGVEPLIYFVQRLLGYCLTGLTCEHVLPVFWGQGRNGKGVMVETVSKVLGDYAGPIPAEMLLDQGRSRSAAGPSPDIMMLKGLRLAHASETDKGSRFSPSRVKWLTGSDTLVGRWPHDRRPVKFPPTHKLLLLTNSKPAAPADDYGFWNRVVLIPFRLSFVIDREPQAPNERRADRRLQNDLLSELPGILAWLMRGCISYHEQGLNAPDIVREATIEYRREDDWLSEWLEDRCIIAPELETRSGVLYQDFETWYQANWSAKVPSTKAWSKMLRTRFEKGHDTANCRIFKGLGLRQ